MGKSKIQDIKLYLEELLNRIKVHDYQYTVNSEELKFLAELSKHKYNYVRAEVADILGYIKNTSETEKLLIEMLSDKNWLVRADAAESLGKKAEKQEAILELCKQIDKDDDVIAMEYMIKAIADIVLGCNLDKLKYIEILKSIKTKHKYYKLQHSCVSSLCKLGEMQYFSEYEKDIRSSNSHKVESVLVNLRNMVEDGILILKVVELVKTIPQSNNDDLWYHNETIKDILKFESCKG